MSIQLPANYKYLISKVNVSQEIQRQKLLDFGCGKGAFVEAALAKGYDCYGAEKYAHGSGIGIKEYGQSKDNLLGRISEIRDDGVLPFEDETFDMVVSNQVFEHIPDLESAIEEISRVLKPGGRLLSIFPCKDAYREGHCEVLFAHRFKSGSRFQYAWLYLNKKLGIGRRKKEKDAKVWVEFYQKWLAENTFYLPRRKVHGYFQQNFSKISYLEADYIDFRLEQKFNRSFNLSNSATVSPVSRWFCRKFGSVVVLAEK